jgi:hypothetical protein
MREINMNTYLIELVYQYKREQWKQEAEKIRLDSLIRSQTPREPSRLRLMVADWLISEGLRLKSGAIRASASAYCQRETS